MEKPSQSKLLPTGLAIFSMFFGAGNLIFAVNLGREFQNQVAIALIGFIITAVLLPILGVVSMVNCGGSYQKFFDRIGHIPGLVLSFFAYLIIGPLVAMPRIITLSQSMFEPYVPWLTMPIFALLFILLTYLFAVKETRILDILGKFISPLLILSLVITCGIGLSQPGSFESLNQPATFILATNLMYGYSTLDFLTSMFFASIVITILKKNQGMDPRIREEDRNETTSSLSIAWFGFKATCIGMFILGIVYICLATLGALHASSTMTMNPAQTLSHVFQVVLGSEGAFLMVIVIFLACLSTIIALSALSAEYLRETLDWQSLPYPVALGGILVFSGLISIIGLTDILKFSKPLIDIAHPLVIILAFIHLADAYRAQS